MKHERHGLSMGIERTGHHFFLSFKAQGKLTHEDYQAITPLLDSALTAVGEPKVIAFIDITELTGWEAGAAWDDFKIGLRHGNTFTRIAILGNRKWQEIATKVGGWFMAGEIEYFVNEQDALSWLKG